MCLYGVWWKFGSHSLLVLKYVCFQTSWKNLYRSQWTVLSVSKNKNEGRRTLGYGSSKIKALQYDVSKVHSSQAAQVCPWKTVQDPPVISETVWFCMKQNMSNITILFTIFCLDQSTEIMVLCAIVCVYATTELNQVNKEQCFEKEDSKSRSLWWFSWCLLCLNSFLMFTSDLTYQLAIPDLLFFSFVHYFRGTVNISL